MTFLAWVVAKMTCFFRVERENLPKLEQVVIYIVRVHHAGGAKSLVLGSLPDSQDVLKV